MKHRALRLEHLAKQLSVLSPAEELMTRFMIPRRKSLIERLLDVFQRRDEKPASRPPVTISPEEKAATAALFENWGRGAPFDEPTK